MKRRQSGIPGCGYVNTYHSVRPLIRTMVNGVLPSKWSVSCFLRLCRDAQGLETSEDKEHMKKEFIAVGRNMEKIDSYDKVTGKATYVADMQLPGMLYATLILAS